MPGCPTNDYALAYLNFTPIEAHDNIQRSCSSNVLRRCANGTFTRAVKVATPVAESAFWSVELVFARFDVEPYDDPSRHINQIYRYSEDV